MKTLGWGGDGRDATVLADGGAPTNTFEATRAAALFWRAPSKKINNRISQMITIGRDSFGFRVSGKRQSAGANSGQVDGAKSARAVERVL